MKKKNSFINITDILENTIYVDNIEFNRYYHHLKPTNYFASFNGDIYSYISDLILEPNLTVKGYYKVNLFINGKCKPVSVHKIVATVYHFDQYEEGYDVDHLDTNKLNNCANNLEWVPRSVNIKRAFDKNLKHGIRGDNHPITVYPDKLIEIACQLLEDGYSISKTSKLTHIPLSYLYGIINGQSRNNITSKFKFPNNMKQMKTHVSDDKKKEIRLLHSNGISAKKISEIVGIQNINIIRNIIYKNYKHIGSTTIEHSSDGVNTSELVSRIAPEVNAGSV